MPVVGNENNSVVGRSSSADKSTRRFATAIKEMAEAIAEETNLDMYLDARKVLMNPVANRAMKDFFLTEAVDPNEYADDPEEYKDQMAMMEALYENDRAQALNEYASIGSFNPVMGLVFPLHKNLLMNNVFDKGAINKAVAKTPKFTLTMEVRKLVTPDGEEIDMFTDQDKLYDAIEATAPATEVYVKLPVVPGTTEYTNQIKTINDAVYGILGPIKGVDALSIETAVTGIVVSGADVAKGERYIDGGVIKTADSPLTGKDLVIAVAPRRFEPGYGELDRQMMTKVVATYNVDGQPKSVTAYVSGTMKNNDIYVQCSDTTVTGALIKARRDTSNAMLRTCSVKWESVSSIVEIPNAIPINTAISPEEVKDVQALYNESQLSKILGMLKTTLGNYKDDRIHHELDDSFKVMPEANKIAATFDFAPPEGYALDFATWRKSTFMDVLDSYATQLINVLNDPNVTISVIGSPMLIRKVVPTDYTYETPNSLGPIELDFKRTVVTSDKRVYNFVASDKLRNNQNLIILLNPRNTDRVIYCIYDYQMYLSNEIRNSQIVSLPAVHGFERFKFVSYQPVQGRLKILNPLGLRSNIKNDDPIGHNLMNDYTTLVPDMTTSGQVTEYPNNSKYDTVNTAKATLAATEPKKQEPTAVQGR